MERSRRTFRGRRVLVIGLGRSGIAAAKFLLAAGARVEATDLREESALGPEAAVLREAGVPMHLGSHPAPLLAAAQAIVLSPGVPTNLPGLDDARRAGVEISSEVDLLAPAVGSRAVAVTGSNGKSTTTALVAAMLGAAGFDAVPCGNFGSPLAEAATADHPGRRYAVELSSFQLETTSALRAAAAILLNVQADHLDRHGDFETYRSLKWKIAELRDGEAPLVLFVDDPELAPLAARARDPVLAVSLAGPVAEGGFLDDGWLRLRVGGREERLAELSGLPLPGTHNAVNILAAAVAVRALGVDAGAIREALADFRPLPHRLEEVARVGGVRFVDDSKATNVASSIEAVRALAGERLIVLLGGRDKGSDFAPLALALNERSALAVTFGEAGPRIAAAIRDTPGCAAVLAAECETLDGATREAWTRVGSGGTVLLSPACASFDAFSGFAARGDAFAAAARRIAEEAQQ